MKTAELSGSLECLTNLTVGDLAWYKAAVAAGKQMGWGYYFTNLLSKHRPGRSATLWHEDEGAIRIFLWSARDSKARLDLYLPPVPMNVAVLRRCLERAIDFNGDSSARVMRLDTKDVDAVMGQIFGLDKGANNMFMRLVPTTRSAGKASTPFAATYN